VQALSLQQIVQRVRGPAGSEVHLKVLRGDPGTPVELAIKRAKVDVPDVAWQMLPGVPMAHIAIRNFGERTDEQLRAALCDVGLDRLGRDADGLDSEWDWPNDLSAGDRHALALARLLLAKPRFAVLDGVPWELGPSRIGRLYQALARTSITYISFGDPSGLLPYHDIWLELSGEGKWRVKEVAHTGESSSAGAEKERAVQSESTSER